MIDIRSEVGLIFDTQYLLQNGGFGTPTQINANFNQHPMPGTGPYVVADVEEGSHVKFTQNPTYWGKDLTPAEIQADPYLDPGHAKNVIIYAKEDDVVRYTELSTGAVQIAGIQSQNWPLVQSNPDKFSYVEFANASEALVGMAMNVERYPTNITAFRQAIVHAVNLTDISQRVFYGMLAPMVGPEYTAEKAFYNLGNLPPYSYDLDLAKKYLAESGVNVATLSPLEFRVAAGCTFCVAAAQIVQADLGQIGIIVTIMVTPRNQMVPPYVAQGGSYTADLAIAQQASQLAWFGSGTWAPASPIPADAWIAFVGNNSPNGNAAIYANPTVQKCVDAWTSTADTTLIKTLCTAAQKQVYDDAPYIWIGSPKLAFGGGSVVFDKAVVKSLLIDPVFTSYSETAIFNTVTFVSS
jgi:ABC-type transport system substrate-binding protein